MKRLLASLLLSSLAVPAASQSAPTPDLLKRAFADPVSKQFYAYDFEDKSEGVVSKDGNRTALIRGHVDPSRKKGDRVTITFAQRTGGDEPAGLWQVDERYERNADGEIFCNSLSTEDITNAVDKGSADGGRLFTFTPRAEADADGEMKSLMKKMVADVVIDEATATVRSFAASLSKPHNVMLVAEIKSANIKADCIPAPDGRSVRSRLEFNVIGSGFGQGFGVKSVQTISNLTPVG